MHISDEGKIGIALALIGIGGGGSLFVFPHPYADYIGWSLIGISVVGLLLLWAYHYEVPIWLAICVIGFCGCAGWYFWPSIPEQIEGSIYVTPQNGTPLPEAYPPEGRIDVLTMSVQALSNGAAAGDPQLVINSQVGIPGAKIPWPEPRSVFLGLVSHFEITNDTPTPLLELKIPLQVNYGTGPFQRYWKTSIKIPRLDQGAANKRSFYIINDDGEGGGVSFPFVAEAIKLGEKERRSVNITRPESPINQVVILWPKIFFPPKKVVPESNIKTAPKK